MSLQPQMLLNFSVPPPERKLVDLAETFASTVIVRVITSLAELFDYKLADLRRDMSGWGELIHPPGELHYELKPGKVIPEPTWSQWLSGARGMPAWRVAQAYVLLELKGLELKQAALAADLPKNSNVRRCLRLAVKHGEVIAKDLEVGRWLMPFRKAMLEWLKSAAHRSDYNRWRAEGYEQFYQVALEAWDEQTINETSR